MTHSAEAGTPGRDDGVDAAAVTRWLRRFAELVAEHRDELTALDAAIGDADHGTNMDRGMTAVVEVLAGDAPATAPGPLLKQVGMTLVRTVGGASGPLYGTFFLRMATALGDDAEVAPPETFAKALRAGLEGIVARGKAEAGDKTMFDALAPAVDALDGALAEVEASRRCSGRRRPRPTWAATRRSRCTRVRGGPVTSASAASATRTLGATSAALLIAAAVQALPAEAP